MPEGCARPVSLPGPRDPEKGERSSRFRPPLALPGRASRTGDEKTSGEETPGAATSAGRPAARRPGPKDGRAPLTSSGKGAVCRHYVGKQRKERKKARLRTEAFGDHEAERSVQYSKRAAVGLDRQAVVYAGLGTVGFGLTYTQSGLARGVVVTKRPATPWAAGLRPYEKLALTQGSVAPGLYVFFEIGLPDLHGVSQLQARYLPAPQPPVDRTLVLSQPQANLRDGK